MLGFTHTLSEGLLWLTHLVLPIAWMRLTVDDPRRLEIASSRGHVVVDSGRRVIIRRGRVMTQFDEIQFIVLRKERRGEYSVVWAVDLHKGSMARIKLGACKDDLDAGLIAARISKALDVPVKYW